METPNKQALPLHVTILMPLRDDWVSATELIRRLDRAIPEGFAITILLVDDGSLQGFNREDFEEPFRIIKTVRILRLRRNLGHQRAIAIGLTHLQENGCGDAVLVMDSDGEDTAEGTVTLLRAYSDDRGITAVFAGRSRRSESLLFKCFYHLYRVLHVGLTGISVRVGNFSILPASYLNTLVAMSELWNHYAAALFRSRLPYRMIPIPRGTRIAGVSRMNFTALVSHGLSAITVFADVVGVRLLMVSFAGAILAGLGIVAAVIIRLFTDRAIPGWATYATGTLTVIMIQFFTIAASFTFFMLSNRTNLGFLPLRDYSFFVESVIEIKSAVAVPVYE